MLNSARTIFVEQVWWNQQNPQFKITCFESRFGYPLLFWEGGWGAGKQEIVHSSPHCISWIL